MPSNIRDSGAATAGVAFARADGLNGGKHTLIVPPQYAQWATEARIWRRSKPMEWLFRRLPERAELVFSGRQMLREFRLARPTHVHIHHLLPSLDFLRACLYSRLIGAKVVWSAHGLVEIVTPRQTFGLNGTVAAVWHVLIRAPIALGAQLCTLIIVGSPGDVRWLRKVGAQRKRWVVVQNGSKFNILPMKVGTIPQDPPVLLFVGAHVRSKGLEVLFEALARQRRPFEMWVAGKRRQTIDYTWADQVNDRDDPLQRIKFLGRVSDEELLSRYLNADLFVLPSWSDTQPLVVVDALATGTPVLASDVGSVREMVGHAGRVVKPGSVPALADALDSLLADPSTVQSMAKAAAERADRFQWSAAAVSVRSVLDADERNSRRT